MSCRFENRLSGQALKMLRPIERIAACAAGELEPAFRRIEAAQDQGYWVALLLDYELGEWLEPALRQPASPAGRAAAAAPGAGARLTALVYEEGRHVPVWDTPADDLPQGSLHTSARVSKDRYTDDIQTLKACIRRGEFYQVNHTFPIAVRTSSAPRDLYKAIAARHPAAHAAYIEDGERTILSFSPELFVARQAGTLTVRPMKGTAPRHRDAVLDQRSGQELLHSEKNRAENLMIVDLLRNDLGRLALPGSVNVDALFSLERYRSVWTLTSTITARAPGKNLQDILVALFPCGSVTGAPKIAAMQKIKSLEARARGIYCGSVGWLAPSGDFSLNVAIRTIEMQNARSGIFGVGGGIVYDSDPALEWEECLWKARVLND
jgi:para-aminobenzoate synthetase component 1